jgi:hypothetical protein
MEDFYCDKCNYKTEIKYCYEKHISTKKHEMNSNESYTKKYKCDLCDKIYTSRVGLWKHNKKCNLETIKQEKLIDIILEKDAEISELKNIIINSVSKIDNSQSHHHSHNNNTTATDSYNNNNFNVNVFLNNECKHAMNINDFIDNIKITPQDFENIAHRGIIEHLVEVIVKNLGNLHFFNQPIFSVGTNKQNCRVHIRDENQWKTENSEMKILETAIDRLNQRHFTALVAHIDKTKQGQKWIYFNAGKNISKYKNIKPRIKNSLINRIFINNRRIKRRINEEREDTVRGGGAAATTS